MSSALASRPRSSREPFDEDVVTAALTVLALVGGSATRAERRLKEQGIEVPRPTLENWRDNARSDQYAAIRDEMASTVQKTIAAEHEDLAMRGAEVTRKMLKRLDGRVDEIPDRDLPGAVRNVATSVAISTDKALAARERPVAMPQAQRDVGELVAALVGMGVAQQVNAGELPQAIDASCTEEREQ